MTELSLAGEAFQDEVSKAIAKQPDVKSYVSRLETQYDESITASEEMPTGSDMVHEIEEFLRSQSGGPETPWLRQYIFMAFGRLKLGKSKD